MKLVYHPRYAALDLSGHVFPVEKYRLVAEAVRAEPWFRPLDLVAPDPLSWSELALVHEEAYLDDLRAARLSSRTRRSELPVDSGLIGGFVFMAGGTVRACREAVTEGRAANLGGGFHHAMPGHAEGFCYVNDLACALAILLQRGSVRRPAVIDLDLHQGNGTAVIFRDVPAVFTFSMHEQGIYPVPKASSSLDIGLPPGTGDATYLDLLEQGLRQVGERHRPDFFLYQAGADPFEGDQLGGLRLTRGGLRQRDVQVAQTALRLGIPLAVTLGGGYAVHTADTAAIHLETLRVLAG